MYKKTLASALLGFSLFTGLASAGIVKVPKENPVFTVDVPAGWKLETIDAGIVIDSPNEVATIYFEVASVGSADKLLRESLEYLETYAPQIQQLFGDSRKFDPTPYRGSVNFVWIDACHEYEFVANDSEKGFTMLKPGGIMAWHDLSRACPSVAKYQQNIAESRAIYWISGTQVAFSRT